MIIKTDKGNYIQCINYSPSCTNRKYYVDLLKTYADVGSNDFMLVSITASNDEFKFILSRHILSNNYLIDSLVFDSMTAIFVYIDSYLATLAQ